MRNKMNILDLTCVAVPRPLAEEASVEDTAIVPEQDNDGKQEVTMEQIPYEMVLESDPGALFQELNRIMADVFENQDDGTTRLVPSTLHKEAREHCSSFGLNCPCQVAVTKEGGPIPCLHPGKKDTTSKKRVFALRPFATDERILAAREKKEQNTTIGQQGQEAPGTATLEGSQQEGGLAQETPKEKRKPGRPPGSKNKRTLDREAEEQRRQKRLKGASQKGAENKNKK